jgi:hypothetical protein
VIVQQAGILPAKCAGRRIRRLQRGRTKIPRSRVSRKNGRRPSKDTGGTDAGTRSAGATHTGTKGQGVQQPDVRRQLNMQVRG